MKSMPLAVAALLAFTCDRAIPAEKEPDPFQPFAFLAGHCFKGELANGKDVDEHCFSWLYGGKALRDTHVVRGSGHADYMGETTYYWDSSARRIEYLYIENEGGVMRGSVEPAEGALVFPAADFVEDGAVLRIRVRWTRLADGGYEVWSEKQDKDSWTTMFRLKMTKSP
jgi:hypothetical protein